MSAVLVANGAVEAAGRGSPLYAVLPDHRPGLVAIAAVPLIAAVARALAATGWAPARRLVEGYRARAASERLAAWLLLVAAAVHAGLAAGHGASAQSLLFAVDAGLLAAVAILLLLGRRWRLAAGLVLTASILAYVGTRLGGEAPDQVGLATKLVELTALAIVMTPARERRLRRLAGSTATVLLVVVSGLAAWGGAFRASEVGGGDHHGGAVPGPGSLIAPRSEREPTPAERDAARRFHERASEALLRYRDPAVAARAGYRVDGLAGSEFHADNPTHAGDGRIFDPARPEALVYAEGARGPVLLGALYEIPELGRPGPAIGGPLTEWHAHENACFGLLPPSFAGLMSPFGGCSVGAIAIPVTAEMIHLWLVPGQPWFGEIDEEARAAFVESGGVAGSGGRAA